MTYGKASAVFLPYPEAARDSDVTDPRVASSSCRFLQGESYQQSWN